jgi:hypothetical protein
MAADKFMTPYMFTKTIRKLAEEHEVSLIDAIIHFCESNSIAVEEVVPLIKGALKDQIKLEGMEIGLLKQEGKLPIEA